MLLARVAPWSLALMLVLALLPCGTAGAEDAEPTPPAVEAPDGDQPAGDAPADEEAAAPSTASAAEQLAEWRQLFLEGSYHKAGRLIARLAEAFPDDRDVLLAHAEHAAFTGKMRKAGRILDDLATKAPDDIEVMRRRGVHAEASGDHAAALATYEAVIAKAPADLETRFRLGRLLLVELGRQADGKKHFEWFYDWFNKLSIEEADALTAAQRTWLGMACWYYDSPHEAIKEFGKALKADASYIDALVAQGVLFKEKYDRPKARKKLEAALQINPHHPDALAALAACHLAEFGQVEEAEAAIAKALVTNPKHQRALQESARARMTAEDYEAAGKILDTLLAENPSGIDALSLRGAWAVMTGAHEELTRIETLLSSREKPVMARFHTAIAEALASRHRYPEAVAAGARALEADPKYAPALVIQGINMSRSGDAWQEGRKMLKRAYEVDSFNVQVFNLLQLFDDYETEYVTTKTEHFEIITARSEKDVIGADLAALLEACYADLTAKYQVTPPLPITVEMLPRHEDFSVRSVGVTGLGALGVCFGRVVTLLSPEGMKMQGPGGQESVKRFNWAQTTWHELGHVITMAKSRNRIPRWFTEGLSVFEEKEHDPTWDRELEIPVYDALASGAIRPIRDLNEGFSSGAEIMLSYYVGSLVCEYIRDRHGFDKILEMLELYGEDLGTPTVIERALGMKDADFDAGFREYLGDMLSEYSLMPRYSRRNINEWRDRLEEGGLSENEQIDLRAKLSVAYWMNNAVADAEIQAADAIARYRKLAEAGEVDEATRLATASAYIILGRRLHGQERIEKAKEYLDKAFELGSDDFFAHRLRAQIAQSENDAERAISEYEAAIAAFPRYVTAPDSPYRQLFALYNEAGESDKAIAILEALCRIDEEDLDSRKVLAKHYQESGEVEKQRQILAEARLITCSDPEINQLWALAGSDDSDQAIRQIRASLASGTLEKADRVRLLTELAEQLLAAGELVEALDAASEAKRLDPEYFRADKVLAQVQAAMASDPEAASEVALRGLEARANDSQADPKDRGAALLEMAKLYRADGELLDARDALERALELPVPIPGVDELLAEIDLELKAGAEDEDE